MESLAEQTISAGKARNKETTPERRVLDGVDLDKALYPQRPRETTLHTMETSLSRLPSFRIIAGWFLLISGLIASFLLTH